MPNPNPPDLLSDQGVEVLLAFAVLTPEQQRFFLGEARLQRWTVAQMKAAIGRVMEPKRPRLRLV